MSDDDGQLRPRFREDGMSFVEFVQDVIPGLSDADAEAVLWELTPFPCVQGRDDLMPHLIEVRDGQRTFESVYAEMDAEIAAAHPEDAEGPAVVDVVTAQPTGDVL